MTPNCPPADSDAPLRGRVFLLALCQRLQATAQLVSPLPPVSVRPPAFTISWDTPTEGRVGELLMMRLRVRNNTKEMRMMRLAFSENDAFLFSGLKLYHFRLPPSFSQSLSFNLLPIKTGEVFLPTPRLLCVTTNAEVIDPHAKYRAYVRPGQPQAATWSDAPQPSQPADVVRQSA